MDNPIDALIVFVCVAALAAMLFYYIIQRAIWRGRWKFLYALILDEKTIRTDRGNRDQAQLAEELLRTMEGIETGRIRISES